MKRLTFYGSTFAAIKDLKGEWKKDDRYDNVYYFVIEKTGT